MRADVTRSGELRGSPGSIDDHGTGHDTVRLPEALRQRSVRRAQPGRDAGGWLCAARQRPARPAPVRPLVAGGSEVTYISPESSADADNTAG